MIEPKELRIGNLLNHSELGIVEVIGVGKDYIHVIYNGETHYENIRSFSTIPLTEEILLKFGFEKIKSDEYPHKFIINKYMRYEVEIENLNSKNCFVFSHGKKFSSIKIEYVHQLQNLYFSLTVKELPF